MGASITESERLNRIARSSQEEERLEGITPNLPSKVLTVRFTTCGARPEGAAAGRPRRMTGGIRRAKMSLVYGACGNAKVRGKSKSQSEAAAASFAYTLRVPFFSLLPAFSVSPSLFFPLFFSFPFLSFLCSYHYRCLNHHGYTIVQSTREGLRVKPRRSYWHQRHVT